MAAIPAELLGPLGLLVGCLLVIYGAAREWWVPGSAYRRALARGDACEAKGEKLAEIAYTNAANARTLADMQKRLLEP